MLALSRRAAFGATVGVALGLHAVAAMGLAAAMSSPSAADVRANARPAMEVRWITAMAPSAAAAATSVPPAAEAPAAMPANAAPPSTSAQQAVPAQRGPEFLGSGEVDEPARPASSWAIDADGPASLGITRIVFDTWVDAQAQVAALRVVTMEPATAASLVPLVEARLAGTPMVAARKGGQPVAHQQRIEMAWQRAPGTPG